MSNRQENPNFEIIINSEGKIPVEGGNVWYEQHGLDISSTPVLLVVHGGPGYPSTDDAPLKDIFTNYQIPIVLYDQLGCGKSDRPKDTSLWTLDRSVKELGQVIESLQEKFNISQMNLYGHSCGATIVTEFLLRQKPDYINHVVLASPFLSAPRFERDVKKLLEQFPQDFRDNLARFEREGTIGNDDYLKLVEQYNRKHIYRKEGDYPPEMEESEEQAGKDVYNTMWGPSELHLLGNLQNYDAFDKLPELNKYSILFTGGKDDEMTPETIAEFQSQIKGSEMVIFEESAHMPQFEQRGSYVEVLGNFLK